MRNVLLVLSLLFVFSAAFSQENPEKPSVKLSGYVRGEIFYDTYKSLDTRDGEMYSYPLRASYDSTGKDINKFGQLEMLGLQSRLRVSGSGASAFGAKASAALEAEFLGNSQDNRYLFVLRHAYVKLDWSKTNLIIGQYWHPNCISEFIPTTVLCGAGFTISPFARAFQVRVTHELTPGVKIIGALVTQATHRVVEPTIYNTQRNSGLPEIHGQIQIGNINKYFFAISGGTKYLKPYLTNVYNGKIYQATRIVSSSSIQISAGAQTKALSIKLQGNLGGNMTNFNMMGGYARVAGSQNDKGQYDYVNFKICSIWTDFETKGTSLKYGIFAGAAQNIGTSKDVILDGATTLGGTSTYTKDLTRDANLKTIYRVSPRVTFISGPVDIGIEYILDGSVYGTFSGKKIINTDKVTINNRMMVAIRYTF